ncbi:ASCH domain-containing protein [Methylicorpusculum oleiharenae]|uniref:ASCH domain-containing protein n=1 Tax=Methylicorpusculum oleiharenae TaxID=1338687 RepID=UPI001357F1EA|nr:ASCH domain-containing protein [Methylicorpusculum oleiharenae]MCD2451281.1 ASCH domain-containing protein [Methylicorpusculum oleiharenae]
MSDLPEKTCTIDNLIRHEKLVAAAKAGLKTQQRRNGVYGWPGERFELQGTEFVVTDLKREKLGDMTDEHAKAEGYPSLESYRDLILRMHPGMNWDPESLVWAHYFEIKA